MKLTFDVSATEFATIRDILLDTLPPDCRVWVFGSRAKNTARFNSDLDLAIEASQGRALPKDTLPRLKDAFNDAPLSYRVDVLDLTEASDDFQAIIRKQAVAFPLPQTDNVPKLRFLEFKSSWKNTSLGKVSGKPAYGMNAAACEFDGKHKYIRITDISDQERAYRPKPLTSPEPPISADYALRAGDIVFTRTGASTGKSYLYKEADGELYFAGFLIRFSIKGAVPAFVFAQTLRSDYENWVSVASTRSGQPGINAQEYAGYKFSIPPLPEQSKIASFLEAADAKITQLSRKKALLEDYKKGCTQKIFSQDIRFKSDQGNDFPDWEERQLGEVVDIKKGQQLNRDDMIEDGKFPVINGGVSASGYTDKSNMSGDVITVSEGGNSCGYVDWQFQSFWLGGHCYALPIKQKTTHAKFVLHKLQNNQEEIMRLRVGSGLPNIQKGSLSKLSISLPHHDEQLKIADFLSAIDIKIDLVAQELSHAKAFKKGLLQQMFV
jgi:type I restriction enzyme S subunit